MCFLICVFFPKQMGKGPVCSFEGPNKDTPTTKAYYVTHFSYLLHVVGSLEFPIVESNIYFFINFGLYFHSFCPLIQKFFGIYFISKFPNNGILQVFLDDQILTSDDFHVKFGSPCTIVTALGETLTPIQIRSLGFNMLTYLQLLVLEQGVLGISLGSKHENFSGISFPLEVKFGLGFLRFLVNEFFLAER